MIASVLFPMQKQAAVHDSHCSVSFQGAAGSTPSSIRSEEAKIIYDENGALADVLIQTYGPVMIRFFSKLPADGALGMRRFTSERYVRRVHCR
jgi:hypothetical protein